MHELQGRLHTKGKKSVDLNFFQKMMIFRKNSNQTIDSRLDRLFVYIQ
jgi:hypothetical protein